MLNNKGLAITTALYSLLVAFLLFLGVTLATFQSASNQLGNANTDIVDGKRLNGSQVIYNGSDKWLYDEDSNANPVLAKINSRYGTVYWPKDSLKIKYSYDSSIYSIKDIDGNEKKEGAFDINSNLKWYLLDSSGSGSSSLKAGNSYTLRICDQAIKTSCSSSATGLGVYDIKLSN